jgi:hypothetical protein
MGDGLWEVRSDLPGNRIARILFSVQQGKILVLHGFYQENRENTERRPGAGAQTQH